MSAIYGAALFGSTYLLPVYMQSALKLAPSLVGAILLPAGLVLAVVIAIVGRLADKVPGYLLVTVGLALLASSFVSMDLVEPLSPLWLLVALSILGRVGLGFILPAPRSEEHTSELQSRELISYAVFCLDRKSVV